MNLVSSVLCGLNRWLTVRRIFFTGACVFLLIAAFETGMILYLNGGVFTYSLDDAYIHLSLAEQISSGHYGINAGEFSSPASSILWPFLLAPFSGLDHFGLVPLWINLAASLALLAVLTRFLAGLFCSMRRQGKALALLTLLLLIPGTNMVGLLFCGMEHSLQVLVAVGVLAGLTRLCRTGQASIPFLGLLILAPLIRYEMLALSLPAVWILARQKKWLAACAVSAGIAAGMIGFAWFLHSLGLGVFPNSVAAKSEIISQSGPLYRVGRNILRGVLEKRGRGIFLLALLSGFAVFRLSRRSGRNVHLLCEWACMAIALHFCFGQFGWFSRYEVYIWTASVLLMLFIVTRKIRGSLSASTSCIPAALLTVFFAVTSPAYLYALVMTPVAANNIYEQQYQIRRFLTEFYQKPLAINDIGLPSFRNDVYVLDIWGLASKAALENRLKKRSNHWMNALAAQHHVDLAVVYETGSLPDNWIPLAEWTLSRRRITPAFDTVTVFSLNPDQIPVQKKRLSRFSETLPPGVSWRWRE